GKTWRGELVEDAADVQLAIGADAGVVTRESEDQLHREREDGRRRGASQRPAHEPDDVQAVVGRPWRRNETPSTSEATMRKTRAVLLGTALCLVWAGCDERD